MTMSRAKIMTMEIRFQGQRREEGGREGGREGRREGRREGGTWFSRRGWRVRAVTAPPCPRSTRTRAPVDALYILISASLVTKKNLPRRSKQEEEGRGEGRG